MHGLLTNVLTNDNITLDSDNIFRNQEGHPVCPNSLLEPLVIKLHNKEELDYEEDRIYGCCIMSLLEILANHHKMKFQSEEVKDECKGGAMVNLLQYLPKYFDVSKGSKAFSYAFRIAYTSAMNTLEKKNKRIDMMKELEIAYDEYMAIENAGHKVTNVNLD